MKMISKVWEWIVGFIRFLRGDMMGVLALMLLVGCSSTDSVFTGSPHGYVGRAESVWGVDMQGTPSIIQKDEAPLHSNYGADGSQHDMPATYNVDGAGNINATGVAAYWLSKAAYCRQVPQSSDCGGVE